MLHNFMTASTDSEGLKARLDAVQEDAMKILDEGGITAFGAKDEWRGEAAALIRQSVVDTFAMTDPTPIFTDRQSGKHGDTVEFETLINTLRVVEYSPQSLPQIFTPRKAKWTISTSSYELAYGIPLQKVINGQHTLGEFAGMAGEALTRHYADMTLTAIDLACAVGSTDMKGRALRTMAAGADVSKPEIDAALRRMYAYNTGVTIFGSRYALDALYTHGADTDSAKDELRNRGAIGRYRGARMVEMVDDHNLFYQSFSKVNGVDLEKLLFIAAGVKGATLLEKDLSQLSWEILDQRAAQWSQGIRMEMGVLVHAPYRYHVVQLA